MNDLRKTQSDFQSYVLGQQSHIHDQVSATQSRDAGNRLGVYYDAYRLRLVEALEQDFPGLRELVGRNEFRSAAQAYIDAFPSTHPSLRWFGADMCQFLSGGVVTEERMVRAEMAQFEWLKGEVFDAADCPVASIEDLCAVPLTSWPYVRLKFHPGLRVVALWYNVPMLWRALEDDQELPATELAERPVPWLIWRSKLAVNWRSLGADEARTLAAARSGARFASLCESLCKGSDDDRLVAKQAASTLKRWVSDGLVAAIESDPAA